MAIEENVAFDSQACAIPAVLVNKAQVSAQGQTVRVAFAEGFGSGQPSFWRFSVAGSLDDIEEIAKVMLQTVQQQREALIAAQNNALFSQRKMN